MARPSNTSRVTQPSTTGGEILLLGRTGRSLPRAGASRPPLRAPSVPGAAEVAFKARTAARARFVAARSTRSHLGDRDMLGRRVVDRARLVSDASESAISDCVSVVFCVHPPSGAFVDRFGLGAASSSRQSSRRRRSRALLRSRSSRRASPPDAVARAALASACRLPLAGLQDAAQSGAHHDRAAIAGSNFWRRYAWKFRMIDFRLRRLRLFALDLWAPRWWRLDGGPKSFGLNRDVD